MKEKPKIGIFGSSAGDLNEILPKAQELGKILAQYKIILITGAATGLPYEVIKAAKTQNSEIEIWGFSPGISAEDELKISPEQDHSVYSKLIYISDSSVQNTPVDVRRKYRNVTSTATCDAGIVISGRWGSLNEFTNLHDMGKIIGVLTGTGGAADILQVIYPQINKPSQAKVIFNSSPEILIQEILKEMEQRNK